MTIINAPKNDFSDIENAIMPFNVLADAYGQDLAAKQLQLEHEAHTEGEKRFLKAMERQIKAGEFADNAVAKPLLSTLAPKFVEGWDEWITTMDGRNSRPPVAYIKVRGMDGYAAAVISLKVALACLTKDEHSVLQSVASRIGGAIEDEQRFGRIRDQEAAHFKKNIKDALDKRVGVVYKRAFMQAVEGKMLDAKQLTTKWDSWTPEERIHVGVKMLELLAGHTGLIELTRPFAGDKARDAEYIQLTAQYVEALSKRAGSLAAIAPMYQPCVVPPKPWVSPTGGGYWAAGRRPMVLIRTGSKKGLERYNDVYMPEVYKAVNIAQDTPWKINKKVLAVANEIVNWTNCPLKEVPALERGPLPEKPEDIDENPEALKAWKKEASAVYRKEKARVSRRLSMEFSLGQANKFSQFKSIWFPYNMDWRGRVYAIPMFNPQGNDMTKGLLTLAEGKPIGADGLYWLKIHGANCAGVDKVSFKERIKFIDDNHENIMETAKNPLGTTWWTQQDSPFCFLAFCFEYAGVQHHGLNYVCSLPLAFDGSCSGIQHFSAMLRDEVGGAAVNLMPSKEVQDIYRIVVERVKEMARKDAINGTGPTVEVLTDKKTGEITEKRKLGTAALAQQWLTFFDNTPVEKHRGVTKRSVMTLAYGSKKFGFRDQVLEDTIKPAIDDGKGFMFVEPNQAAGYMAELIWDAVSVTVVAAVGAMSWLQKAAALLAAEVKDKKTKEVLRARCAVHWVTPDGFPVWQEYKKPVQARLNLMFLGMVRLQPTVNTNRDNGIDARKQEAGIAPNFVHSMDGSHLRKTVVMAHEKYGVKSFALIHDSFGTIPADAGSLFMAVRETLVETYEGNDVLADFAEQFMDQLHESQLDSMPPMPPKGTLNLQDILKSEFAFA